MYDESIAISVIIGLVLIDGIIATAVTIMYRTAIVARQELVPPGPRALRLLLAWLILNVMVLLAAGSALKDEALAVLGGLAAFVLGGLDLRPVRPADTANRGAARKDGPPAGTGGDAGGPPSGGV